MKKKSLSEQFCQDILTLGVSQPKALANLVMALSSCENARSVVQLSESLLYHYQFSSIFKSIHELALDKEEYEKQQLNFLKFCLNHIQTPFLPSLKGGRMVLQTDVTPVTKAHSPSLENRQYVHVANTIIKGNKPISVGYPISSINFCAAPNMSLPLVRGRVPLEEKESIYGAQQLLSILGELTQTLGCDLVINTADRGYTHAGYLSELYAKSELVSISRARNGVKVYAPVAQAEAAAQNAKKGAPKVYGDCFFLKSTTQTWKGTVGDTEQVYEREQRTIHDHPYSDYQVIECTTSKGRAIRIQLTRWNDMKIRSKNKYSMKEKPIDVLSAKVFDAETDDLIFKDELFCYISGQRKDEITTIDAYHYFRSRYGIEPSFRFNKQKMFLDGYDCEQLQHFDNFLLVNQLSNWLLYLTAQETAFKPKKWEKTKTKTDTQTTTKTELLSLSKARRAAEAFFLTFDPKPFLPKTSNKGKGNIKKARPKFKVLKKTKKKEITQKKQKDSV